MSLKALREPTTDAEHRLAVDWAERRLGRDLTAAEKRIDIVGQDRDLRNGKAALVAAVKAEQRRAVEAWVTNGTPIRLKVTKAMTDALSDLYDAGVEHATAELEAAGVKVS